ncbi:hypothetical protein SDC9_122683 [bioreactor metagenome]|uniref:Uncharacterized protein n=1 Tax=bioreactor metagenome TaxID=1076179 RepID=A0A645CFD8_9ZZZZ
MVLIGNQPGADFSIGYGWKHRLCAFARVTAPNAAYVKSWPNTGTLIGSVSFFAENLLHAKRFFVFFERERSLCHHISLLTGNLHNVVVKSGNQNPSVIIRGLCNHFCQHIDGVSYRTAKNSGV